LMIGDHKNKPKGPRNFPRYFKADLADDVSTQADSTSMNKHEVTTRNN